MEPGRKWDGQPAVEVSWEQSLEREWLQKRRAAKGEPCCASSGFVSLCCCWSGFQSDKKIPLSKYLSQGRQYLLKTWNSDREIVKKKNPYVICSSLRSRGKKLMHVVGGYCFSPEKLRECLSIGKRNHYSKFPLLIKYHHIVILLIEEGHKNCSFKF